MSIKTKLRLAFAFLIGIFVAFGFIVLQVLSAVSNDSSLIATDILTAVRTTYAIDVATSDYRTAELLHVLSKDAGGMDAYEKTMERLKGEIAAHRAEYELLVDTPEERQRYDSFARSYAAYLAGSTKMIALSREDQIADATTMIKQSAHLFESLSGELEELVRLATTQAAAANGNTAKLIGTSRMLILGGLAVVLVFGGICLWAVDTGIGRPIVAMTGTLNKLAEGDFAPTAAPVQRADDIGQMARAVEATGMAVRALASDLGELVEAANGGMLSTRVEVIGHGGDYATLVKGMNELIEGLTRPLFEVVEVMQMLAAGDLRGRMTGAYEGDLRALKANLNRSLDALVTLLSEVGTVSAAVAQGDLTRTVAGTYQGEYARLKTDLNQAVEHLRTLVADIAGDTEQTAVSVTQTTAAARQVADLSASQLGVLTTVAAGIGQTSAAVDTIAHNAERGSELAARTTAFAEDGRARLLRLAGSVERIAGAHERIEQITGKIARISDKTHILSLNAGIEAARAGQEGRGFGIVAQQIGRLAEEAAVAAQDIEQIIAESTQLVRSGVAVTGEAQTAIEQIAEAAQDSSGVVQAISVAITQQSAAVRDLHERVSSLRASSQGAAGAAEEICATMEELARMIHRTRDQISRFVLVPSESRVPCPPLSPASSANS